MSSRFISIDVRAEVDVVKVLVLYIHRVKIALMEELGEDAYITSATVMQRVGKELTSEMGDLLSTVDFAALAWGIVSSEVELGKRELSIPENYDILRLGGSV